MFKKTIVFCLLIGFAFSAKAQLSDLHYLPPLKQGRNNQGIQQQEIHLSTPETGLFTVNVYRGTSTVIWNSYTINNTTPAVIDAGDGLTNGDNNITLVSNANTGVVLTNSGLRFESPSSKEFYVNYRGKSNAQAASLTSKGREAIGTNFRWGGVPNLGAHSSKSNTLGIMATADNTTITLSGYDPSCTFRQGVFADGITANNYTITLDANESFVFENYVGNRNFASHVDGWIGASILSDKDIVISNGAINYGRQLGSTNRDAGIDQPVPVTNIGKDYVFIRGNGSVSGVTEFPLIIATADNTNIEIGGTIIATIDNGEYFQVPSGYYSGTTAGANMYIYTSKDTYAYQCLAGSTGNQTAGLNFIAPVNCLLPDVMDNIPNITNIAGSNVSGNLTIIAAVNTPDANIQVFENGVLYTGTWTSQPVLGTSDWKTIYITGLNGNISAQSTGPMAVGFFGANGNQGVAGYFSGFDTLPEVVLDIASGSIGDCFSDANIFVATANFDAYQWFYEGDPIVGATSIQYTGNLAGDYFVRGTKGPCTYDSDPLAIFYCEPDVSITKSVADPEIVEGETTVFTIRAENFGFQDVTNLQIIDNIPAGLTLISGLPTAGSWNGTIWNVGTLTPGTPVFLELEVRGNEIDIEPLLSITNTVSNIQTEVDNNLNEDILSATVIVHNDFDNDGVIDIVDLDDDNDGVYDDDECNQSFCFESIINESFETPVLTSNYQILSETSVPGWLTTATDSRIELWRSGFLGVDSYNGNQHAELNANRYGALYQNLCLTPGTIMNWSLRHRGRSGVDEMQLRIGADLSGAAIQQTMSTDNDAWVLYSGTYTVPAGQTNTAFIFEAISTANGSISVGNFIDDVKIDIAVPATCVDSDGDGYPNNIDLDRDNDGCSDADEWYKDNNADADDGGEFGSGVPVVDPNDGTVLAASYLAVIAPEILLKNTSEDIGGSMDITGQDINLGTTFDYVLRFQNNGDDNATGYTIRNILPDNVTLDNIDISGADPLVTSNHDPITNGITFQIPDNLVEAGDPEYTIRITVTLSDNCGNFTNACSDILKHLAYSTYQGVTNTNTISDEPGSSNLPVCSPAAPVAVNTINGLANCNVAQIVQLCDENITLTAGTGFTTYNWAIDINGNGQIDPSEPIINDGDPDGDPSTIVVLTIGNYIVEKSGAIGCADLVELITVENFGSTQTNPITTYFNQVNNDVNPDNDLQGGLAEACRIDGSEIPEIFLCGENDDALIQLSITSGDSIVWQKLDEASCAASVINCANTNPGCSWTDLSTDDFYTLTDAGQYRILINYSGGCFSRFYFNVFKNTLDINYISSDIICSTEGNIRITNPVTGYGYQLIDNATNVAVPGFDFAAGQGPSFDITASGSYKVQITQLDPVTDDPIAGACIFETEDIGISERAFEVTAFPEPADCSGFGQITVQALNVLPNYNFQLFLDDGSTLVQENIGGSDNTHTFTTVPPGGYVLVTTTDNGCDDTQNITVDEIQELDLSASVTENITCNAGLVSLTPSGGDPDPNYLMAIWSINGVAQYPSEDDAFATATFQTTNDFLFLNSSDAGTYQFIVFDSTGCFDKSEIVTVLDLGSVVIDNITASDITCVGAATSILTITATGGTAPYEYSRDGVNFQATNTFPGLGGGWYTITVRDSSGTATSRCMVTQDYEIQEPFELNASATIVEDLACDPNGTLVKILNARGGQPPYEYSFDGGSNFDGNNERSLSGGTYQLVLKDDLGCTFDMEITVPSSVADPALTIDIDYNCIGEGSITVNTSNTTDFNYSYSLDGGTTTQTSNVFNGLATGNQTVTVGYASTLTANQSTLFIENFGTGSETQIAEAGSRYCFEPQDGTANACNRGPAGILVNGEYTVTNAVTNTNPFLRSPQDHTGLTDGRFFAIDISNFSDTGLPELNTILWSRDGIEVLPNQEITVSFWAYNLMMNTQMDPTYVNPEVLVEILDNTGTVIYSEVANEIPKNTNDLDWHQRPITFNPGANTEINIVFRTNRNDDDGNDLILDDITISQLPEVCERTQDLTDFIVANQAFAAQLLGADEPNCNGEDDASIRFEVLNFPATGFQYSTDGVNWTTSMVSEVTTTTPLTAGTYTIQIVSLPLGTPSSCTTDFTVTIDEPTVIVPGLQLTADFTCFNTGATLEAWATQGTPGYEYRLEDTAGVSMRPYQTSTTFSNVPDGVYLVRVRDTNNCDVLLPLTDAVTVDVPETVAFNTTPTSCYSGASNGSVVVDVTSGNADYTFRITRSGGAVGAWFTPDPITPNTYTFTGLTNGTYDVEVDDSFGCGPVLVTVDINSELTSNATLQSDLSCTNDAVINLNTTGGSGTYVYEWSNTNAGPWNTTGFTGDTFATATAGTYFFRVTDTTTPTVCTLITNSETVSIADTPVITSVTPTDLSCNGNDTGSLAIVIDTSIGLAPYIINVLNTTTSFDYGNQTTSLAAGNYTITVTDSKNCFVTQTTTIDEPLIITSNIIKTDLICTLTGMQLGTITVDASGGTADYKYRVNNIDFSVNDTYDTSSGTNDHTFTGLDFGDYMVTITDSNNCETIENVTITTGPDVLITTQGATGCTPGSGEMMVEAQASNGTLGLGNFYFAIFPAPAFNALDPAWQPEDVFPALDNTHLFTGLTPGVEYTFVVHDTSTNCEFVQKATVPVSSASNLNANIDNATAITCNGFADGMVEFTISGYDATTVHYEIFASVTNTSTGISGTITGPTGGPETETVNSLSPGEFYILFTETDGPNLGCVNTSPSFVIEQAPTLLIVTANATKNENCNELGIITASGNSGVGPYEYQFLPDTAAAPTAASAAWTNNTVSNVAAGDYIVYILDANSCVQFTPVTVGFDTAPEIDTITVVDFCAINGSYEVEITLTTPDTASYNISVNGGSLTSANFVGGVFTVTGLSQSASLQTLAIQDVNGCGNTENFEISPKFQATALLSNKLLDCSTSPNPEIIISSFDGYGPFAYEITGPVSQALTAIPSPANSVVWDGSTPAVTVTPGSYIVSVYDTGAIGCGPKTFTIEIEPAVVPDFSGIPVNVICNGGLGSISLVQNNNGINPLSYDIAPAAGTFNATTQTYEDLPANTYTITATGTNGCPAVRTITIDEPTAIIITPATIVEFGCTSGNSIDNAKITVPGASGGSDTFTRYRFFRTDDPITVAIEPDTPLQHTSSNSFIESNYNGGYYGIEVFDDAGCSEIINARILPFDELQSASISIIDPISCTSSGEDISFDIIGNVTTYTSDPTNYEIRLLPSTAYEAPGDNTFNNLTAGTYTFGIHNINTGCEFFIEHTVEDPNTYDINVNKLTDAICFGDDGSIEIAFSDTTYTGDYEWEVLNADGSTTVRTDDEGTFTGNGTTAAIPITTGSFIVNVRQAGFPGCTQERTVTITTPPAPIDLNPIVSSSVGCSNNQGTAQIIPTGGVGPYDITLTNNTTLISTTEFGSFGHLFTDLSEGSYDVSITDSNSKPSSCTEIFSNRFSLVRPNYITGIIDPLGLIIACRGDNDGIVRFALDARNTTPDVPTYNHSLNTYDDLAGTTLLRNSALQTSPDFGNQGAGFYSITVTDDLGCSFETPIVEIIEPVEVEALLVTNVPISCLTGTDLLLTASGGTGPYEWSIDNIDANYGPMTGTGGSTHLIPNVSVGTYNFYVRDSFECVAIVSNTVTINPIVPLSVPIISVTPLACFDDNTAIIVADAIGGLGEYEYALFDATTNTEIIANQFSGMFTDLASGTYYVRVQGRGDCEERSIDVLIENPDELVVRETITEISCSGANDGSITLDSVGGTEDFLYAISPNLSQFSPDNTFDELEPGDYTVIAQDTNGCFKLKEFTLRDPDPLLMTLSATPEICAGTANGSITVTPTGGTPPYHTAIDSDNDVDFVEGRVDFDNLKAGDYWIYVKDANKCLTRDLITVETGANLNTTHEVVYECSGDVPTSRINIVFEDESISDVLISLDAITGGDFNTTFENLSPGDHYFYMLHPNGCDRTVNFVVEAFEPLVLTLEQLDLNEITANVTGGKKGYTYYIDDQDNGDDNTFYITRTDTYSVRVVDENGCESTAAIEMEFIDIEIPNFFTPDGDGLNDSWIPRNITQFPDIFIKIYDRYGREIYIIQDSEDGWNGLYQDTDLPTGDYWYVIKLNGEEDEREFVGNFTLYR